MKSSLSPALAVAFVVSAPWAVVAGALDPASVKTPKMSPVLIAGKEAYETHCASCHGSNAVGTEKGPPFLHRIYHPGHHSDQSFFLAAMRGARAHHWNFGDMKPVDGVTNKALERIVRYIRALQKANGIF